MSAPRNYKADHDYLTDRYCRQGNPDELTPGQFLTIHDSIWLDREEERGPVDQDEEGIANHAAYIVLARKDITARAKAADRNPSVITDA